MDNDTHLYKARVIDVYDGDSITVIIELDDFDMRIKAKLRLLGINTPEIRTKDKREKAIGKEARDYLRELILDKEVLVDIIKKGKYGRHLSYVYYNDIYINDLLIKKGYAKVYYGGKRNPWFSDDSE